jgi:hypothetical protein
VEKFTCIIYLHMLREFLILVSGGFILRFSDLFCGSFRTDSKKQRKSRPHNENHVAIQKRAELNYRNSKSRRQQNTHVETSICFICSVHLWRSLQVVQPSRQLTTAMKAWSALGLLQQVAPLASQKTFLHFPQMALFGAETLIRCLAVVMAPGNLPGKEFDATYIASRFNQSGKWIGSTKTRIHIVPGPGPNEFTGREGQHA